MSKRAYVRSAATRPLPVYTCALCCGPAVRADFCYGCGHYICGKHKVLVGFGHQARDHKRKHER